VTAPLHELTIAAASELIARRALSPVELTQAHLARIRALEPQLNAFITVTEERALEQAQAAERDITAGRRRGPLHGVPFALKDIYDTAGILTSGHSRTAMDNVPATDATTTRKLYDAGAVLLGKLATHEFAHGGPSFDLPWPPARNPWHLEHFTGGSSSGSGAALAARLTPAALGSDTGGSIRGPASYCGVTGFMPTYGLVSRAGVMPNSFTFDHCGPMARTVEDCALLLQAIAGYDERDPGSIEQDVPDYRAALAGGVKGWRIGVLRHYWEDEGPAHPEVGRVMDEAIGVFRALGATVEDCRSRPMMDGLDIKVVVGESEIFAVHQRNLVERPGDFGRDFLGRILPACLIQGPDYVQALREHRRYMAAMRPLYERYDLLLTCGFGPAPRLDAHRTVNFWARSNAFTPSNVARSPALVMCGGFSAAGLPIGVQLIGAPFRDVRVLRAGHAFQQATDWHLRSPQLASGSPQPVVVPQGNEPDGALADARTRDLAHRAAVQAGLRLDDRQMAILLEAAPYALAMIERLRQPREREQAPSLVFRFTPGL